MPQPPKYSVTPDGQIRKGEAVVGFYDPATGRIEEPGKFPQGALSAIKSLILDEVIAQRIAHQPPAPPEAGEQHTAATMRAAFAPDIPPEPPMDPRMGDKTPAYMEWLSKYHPELYEARYKGRKTPVGKVPWSGQGDIPAD